MADRRVKSCERQVACLRQFKGAVPPSNQSIVILTSAAQGKAMVGVRSPVTLACATLLVLLTGCVMSREPIRPPGPIDDRLFGSWVQVEPKPDEIQFEVIYQIDGPWMGFVHWTYPMKNLSDLDQDRYRGFISTLGEQGFINIVRREQQLDKMAANYVLIAYRFDDEGRLEFCPLNGEGGVIRSAVLDGQIAGEIGAKSSVVISSSSGEIARLLAGASWEDLCRGSERALHRRFE